MQVITRLALITLLAGATTAHAAPDYNPDATLIYFDAIGNQTLDPQEPQNNSSFAPGVLDGDMSPLVTAGRERQSAPGLAELWRYNC